MRAERPSWACTSALKTASTLPAASAGLARVPIADRVMHWCTCAEGSALLLRCVGQQRGVRAAMGWIKLKIEHSAEDASSAENAPAEAPTQVATVPCSVLSIWHTCMHHSTRLET